MKYSVIQCSRFFVLEKNYIHRTERSVYHVARIDDAHHLVARGAVLIDARELRRGGGPRAGLRTLELRWHIEVARGDEARECADSSRQLCV